jgi:hypothetical protein
MCKFDTELELRECSVCSVPMIDGYCFDGGMYYACSDEHRNIIAFDKYNTAWEDLYTDEGDFYYTEWFDELTEEELEEALQIIRKFEHWIDFIHDTLKEHYDHMGRPQEEAEEVIQDNSLKGIERWLIRTGYDLEEGFQEYLRYKGLLN